MLQIDNKTGRLLSLDALRGLDMLFIMGLAPAVVGLCGALGFGEVRWASVLGRIGLAWAFAALLYLAFSVRTRIAVVVGLLGGGAMTLAMLASAAILLVEG